jgi:uncharacterized membrane protein
MSRSTLAKQALVLALALILLPGLGRGPVPVHVPIEQSQASPLVATDFAISASPDSLVMPLGTTATSSITLTSLGSFSGSIFLSASAQPLDVSLNTTEVTLNGNMGFATISILAPTSVAPGDYTVSVEGSSGCSLSHNARITVTVTGPDFSISAQKSLLTIQPGSSDTSGIGLSSMNGFSGLVSLYSDSTPLTSTLGPSTLTLSSGGAGTSTLTVSVPVGTRPGNYTVEVTGITSSLLHIIDITVTVTGSGFVLSAEPFSLTVDVTGVASNSSTVTVTPFGGFVGGGAFTNSYDASKFTLALSTTSFTIPGAPTSSLTLTVLASTPPGLYFITVNGTSGSFSQSVDIPVTVNGPDFELAADPASLTVAVSSSCTSTITVTTIEAFTGTVSLSLFPSGLSVTLLPTSITGSGTSTLTVSATGGILPGTYFVTIQATSSPLVHFLNIAVLVTGPDFSLSPDPDVLTIQQGLSGTSTIHAVSVSNFAGTISLLATTSVTGITPSISPNSIPSGSGSSTLMVDVASSVAPGSYTVVVTGVSGLLIHAEFLSIEVTGPDFSISSDSYTVTISTTSPGTSTIAVAPLNGFTGQVGLSVVASFDLNASIQPAIISSSETAALSVNSTVPGSYTVIVSGSSGLLFHSIIVSVTVLGTDFLITSPDSVSVPVGVQGNLLITVTSSGGFADSVTLASTVSPTGLSCSLTPNLLIGGSGTSSLLCSGSSGTYSVTVTGTSNSAGPHSKTVTFTVSDFTMSAAIVSPSRVLVDSQGTSTVTITPTNGFTGTVDLSLSQSSPPGLSCTIPVSVILSSSPATATLSCSASTAGDYSVTLTGTSGSPSTATLSVLFHISDFTLSTSPSTLSVNVGATGSTMVDLTSVNDFSGTVGLSYSVSPSTGLVCTLSPAILAGSGSSNLSCTSSASGTFTVTVTGTSGSLHRSATSTVSSPTPDFSLTSTPPSITIQAGGSGSTVIVVTPAYGFSDAVDLSAMVSPSGPTVSLGTNTIAGGSGNSTLTINVGSEVAVGTYMMTVQGTTGGLHHSAQVTVTVTSASVSGTSDILGVSPTIFYPLIAVVVVSLALVAVYFLRVRRRTS